jgi:hypothetical protein
MVRKNDEECFDLPLEIVRCVFLDLSLRHKPIVLETYFIVKCYNVKPGAMFPDAVILVI